MKSCRSTTNKFNMVAALSIGLVVLSGCVTGVGQSYANILRKIKIDNIDQEMVHFYDILDYLYKSSNEKLSENGEFGIAVIVDALVMPDGFKDKTFGIHLNDLSIYDAFYEFGRQTGVVVEFNGNGTFLFHWEEIRNES